MHPTLRPASGCFTSLRHYGHPPPKLGQIWSVAAMFATKGKTNTRSSSETQVAIQRLRAKITVTSRNCSNKAGRFQ